MKGWASAITGNPLFASCPYADRVSQVKYDPEPVQGYDRAFTSDPFGNRIELVGPHAKSP